MIPGPELPEDIVFLILKEAYYLKEGGQQSEHTPDRTLLRCCSLVNSTWSRPAQNLLFRDVILNPKFVEVFLGGELKESESALLQHVRIATTRRWESSFDIDDLGTTVLSCLERCTSLYELGIHAGGPISFSQEIMDSLGQVACAESRTTPLRSLRVHECGVQSRVVEQLVSTFPTLEFLVIDCEVGLPPKAGRECNVGLYELRLTRNIRTEFLEWLLQYSEDSLQVLELRDLPGRPTRDTLRPYCDTIRSLRLMPFNQISAEIVTMCTNLEELRLMGIPNIFPLPAVLPANLHHLEIVLLTIITSNTRLASLTRVVKSHSPLRLLTIRTGWKVETVPDYAELVEACQNHGVVLNIDTHGFWPLETLVKKSSFPRRRSVSNFNLMS